MLDEQILKMAESNNINAEAVLASTETLETGKFYFYELLVGQG